MAIVYDPRGFRDFQDWACLMLESFADLHVEDPRRYNDENWAEWAYSFQTVSAFNSVDIPRPEFFSDWKDWAQRIYQQAQDIPEDA